MKKLLLILLCLPIMFSCSNSNEEIDCNPIPNPNKNAINDLICTCYWGERLTEKRKEELIQKQNQKHQELEPIVRKGLENYNSLNNSERKIYDRWLLQKSLSEERYNTATGDYRKRLWLNKMNKSCWLGCCSLFCWEDNYRQ